MTGLARDISTGQTTADIFDTGTSADSTVIGTGFTIIIIGMVTDLIGSSTGIAKTNIERLI
ncbi:MAG: hypothetical protein ACE5HC_10030 [Candidatus Binatia bacterium]